MNITTTLTAAALTTFIAGCGGSGSGGSAGSDTLFDRFNEEFGTKAVTQTASSRTTGDSFSQGCEFNEPFSREQLRAVMRSLGLTITVDTPDELRATGAGGAEASLAIAGSGLLFIDRVDGFDSVSVVQASAPRASHRAILEFNSNGEFDFSSSVRDDQIVEGPSFPCPLASNKTAEAVNGSWFGPSTRVSTNSREATTKTVSMSCTDQVCGFTDAPDSTFTLGKASGVPSIWTGQTASSGIVAILSADEQLLAVLRCTGISTTTDVSSVCDVMALAP